jgi:hypothetical protein
MLDNAVSNDAYLDLLKRCLTNCSYEGWEEVSRTFIG